MFLWININLSYYEIYMKLLSFLSGVKTVMPIPYSYKKPYGNQMGTIIYKAARVKRKTME